MRIDRSKALIVMAIYLNEQYVVAQYLVYQSDLSLSSLQPATRREEFM
jgi:hypothetical protein